MKKIGAKHEDEGGAKMGKPASPGDGSRLQEMDPAQEMSPGCRQLHSWGRMAFSIGI